MTSICATYAQFISKLHKNNLRMLWFFKGYLINHDIFILFQWKLIKGIQLQVGTKIYVQCEN